MGNVLRILPLALVIYIILLFNNIDVNIRWQMGEISAHKQSSNSWIYIRIFDYCSRIII